MHANIVTKFLLWFSIIGPSSIIITNTIEKNAEDEGKANFKRKFWICPRICLSYYVIVDDVEEGIYRFFGLDYFLQGWLPSRYLISERYKRKYYIAMSENTI